MTKSRHKPSIFLTALAPLLCVYIPRPPISGSQFLVYPGLAFILSILIFLLSNKRKKIDTKIYSLIFLLLIYTVCLSFSFLFNSQYLRTTAIFELARPVLLTIFLLYGYYVSLIGNYTSMRKGLLKAAYFILIGQAIVGLSQALGFDFFNSIYSAEKSFEFGSLVRITGSLGNPNIYAWIVSQASIIILLLSAKKSKYLWVLLGASLIVISGSRSLFILFPLMIIFSSRVNLFQEKKRKSWQKLLLGVVIIVASVGIVVHFADLFPYLSQISEISDTGSLESVNSINSRLELWEFLYQEFTSEYEFRWLFGLGSREIIRIADNDYIYVFFRIGFIGFLVHLSIVYQAFKVFAKSNDNIGILGKEYLLFSLIFGLVSDTISGWFFPLFLFFFLGITIGLTRKARKTRQILTFQQVA